MINKSLLVGMASAVMLLSACSSTDEVSNVTETNQNQIQITINNGGTGLVSRTPRDLYTIASADNVDHVTMKLYRYVNGAWEAETGCFTSEEIAWSHAQGTDVSDMVTNVVKVKNLNENTQYKVVAYGYNGSPCPYNVTDNGSTLIATPKYGKPNEELFAGASVEFQTDGDARITELVDVKMDRMVAGLLAYFKNIPVYKILPGTTELRAVRYINVYTCAQSSGFVFPSKEEYNGYSQEATQTNVLTIDLKEEIPDYDSQVQNSKDVFSATFNIDPLSKEGSYLSTVPNSIIKGCFLLPFESAVDQTTLVVELADVDNNVLKHWNVKNGDDFCFNIQRNSFYSLGKKVHDSATGSDPNDPFDPDGPEGDEPIDISTVELAVTILDRWDRVFFMTLKP